jgi:hypothetical protein
VLEKCSQNVLGGTHTPFGDLSDAVLPLLLPVVNETLDQVVEGEDFVTAGAVDVVYELTPILGYRVICWGHLQFLKILVIGKYTARGR